MKIARYRSGDQESWGVVDTDAGTIREIVGAFQDWSPAVTARGEEAVPFSGKTVELDSVKLLAPISVTSKILGTGSNYRSHIEGTGGEIRSAPTVLPVFCLPMSCIINPDEEMNYPNITNQLDFEVELVCVVGSKSIADRNHGIPDLLGYTIGNDTSARDCGMPPGGRGDLTSMKGQDRTKPLGPWIVTRDEISGDDQPAVDMITRINGEERQHDNTKAMVSNIDRCLQWLNDRFSLTSGDIVYTGTVGGTAIESEMREPGTGRFLEPGDRLELEIEGIGVLRNAVGQKGPDYIGWTIK